MPSDVIKALFLGDVIGQSGSRALFVHLPTLKKEYAADIAVVNCENAENGFGITPETANRLFASGADVLTSGNHIWQKREILDMLETDDRFLRPANYPGGVAGKGYGVYPCGSGKLGVVNLLGRVRLSNVSCPFRAGRDILKAVRKETNCILIDFHAEDPEEKEALAWYLDGKMSLLVGTHTHVQTADEEVLPEGTAYLTDVGMTGPHRSVIGSEIEAALSRFLRGVPARLTVATGQNRLHAVLIELEPETGKARGVIRIMRESV